MRTRPYPPIARPFSDSARRLVLGLLVVLAPAVGLLCASSAPAQQDGLFQERSVLHGFERPPRDPDDAVHYVVTVIGNRLTLDVDGKRIFDFVDQLRAGEPFRGGYFGFRNFRPTPAWYDNIKVYRLRGTGAARTEGKDVAVKGDGV